MARKIDISAAFNRCVLRFNKILEEKKGKNMPHSKCSTKMDSLKRTYRENLDLKNKSGEKPVKWVYFEVNILAL